MQTISIHTPAGPVEMRPGKREGSVALHGQPDALDSIASQYPGVAPGRQDDRITIDNETAGDLAMHIAYQIAAAGGKA